MVFSHLMDGLCERLADDLDGAFPDLVRALQDDMYSGLRSLAGPEAEDLDPGDLHPRLPGAVRIRARPDPGPQVAEDGSGRSPSTSVATMSGQEAAGPKLVGREIEVPLGRS